LADPRRARPAAPAEPRRRQTPWGQRLRGALADALDLPRDMVLDLPRITLLGALHLSVENHRGLIAFAPGEVAIATAGGRLLVAGEDLAIGVARPGEITVTGRLSAVRFEPAASGGRPGA